MNRFGSRVARIFPIASMVILSTSASAWDFGLPGLLAKQMSIARATTDLLNKEKLNAGRPVAGDDVPAGTPLLGSNGGQVTSFADRPQTVRAVDVAPPSLSKVIRDQTDSQRSSLAQSIQVDIDNLQTQIDERLNREIKTPEVVDEITALNDTLIVKRQTLSLALGRNDIVTAAAAESFLNTSNPYFLMCADTLWVRQDPLKWVDLFAPVRPALLKLGRSVGALMVDNRLAGTAFVVGKGLILTNAHVLRAVGEFDTKAGVWRIKPGTTVTFDLEYRLGQDVGCDQPNTPRTYAITGALFSGEDAKNKQIKDQDLRQDFAVLLTGSDAQFPPAVVIAHRPPEAYAGKMVLAVIGYPGPPTDMTIAERMQYFSGPDTIAPVMPFKRLAGGFSADRAPNADGLFPHLANTAGGNSGSPIVDLSDGSIVGIHVRGEDRSLVTAKNWGISGDNVLAAFEKNGLSKKK